MMFWRAPNYLIAMLFCVAFTVMAALAGRDDSIRWLIVSDINVAIWLTVAWFFDPNRSRK